MFFPVFQARTSSEMLFLEKTHLVFHKSGIFHENEPLLLLAFFLISPLDFLLAKPGDILSPGWREESRTYPQADKILLDHELLFFNRQF